METTFRHIFPEDRSKRYKFKYLALVAILAVFAFSRCNNSGGNDTSYKYDTLEFAMLYENILTREGQYGYGVRWIRDSFEVIGTKVNRKIDTFWFSRKIDTLKNTDGTPKKDSLGRIFVEYNPKHHPEKLILIKFLDHPPPFNLSSFPDMWLRKYGTKQDSINLKLIK